MNYFFPYCPELPIWPKIENPYWKLDWGTLYFVITIVFSKFLAMQIYLLHTVLYVLIFNLFLGQCNCDEDFKGTACNVPACPQNCEPNGARHGSCNKNLKRCECFDGWTGEDCSQAFFFSTIFIKMFLMLEFWALKSRMLNHNCRNFHYCPGCMALELQDWVFRNGLTN